MYFQHNKKDNLLVNYFSFDGIYSLALFDDANFFIDSKKRFEKYIKNLYPDDIQHFLIDSFLT